MHIKFEEELQRVIARRAHELSRNGKSEQSDDISDWLKAEREIMHELDRRSDSILKNNDLHSA